MRAPLHTCTAQLLLARRSAAVLHGASYHGRDSMVDGMLRMLACAGLHMMGQVQGCLA